MDTSREFFVFFMHFVVLHLPLNRGQMSAPKPIPTISTHRFSLNQDVRSGQSTTYTTSAVAAAVAAAYSGTAANTPQQPPNVFGYPTASTFGGG